MLNVYILWVSVVVSVLVGLIVVMSNIRSLTNMLYGCLTALFIVFAVANFLTLDTGMDQLYYIRLVMAATSLIVAGLYLFVSYLYNRDGFRVRRVLVGVIFSTITTVLCMTPLLFSGLQGDGSPPVPVAGPAMILYLVHFFVYFGLMLKTLAKISSSQDSRLRSQSRLIMIGILPALTISPVTAIILPQVFGYAHLMGVSPLYSLFFVSCVGYAIFRHKLFDIKLALVRTIGYTLSLTTLALLYFFAAYIVSTSLFSYGASEGLSVGIFDVLLALMLAFLFQPIRRFFDRATDRIFYRDTYNTEEFYARINDIWSMHLSLRGLLRKVSANLVDSMRANSTFFFVATDDERYVVAGSSKYPKLSSIDLRAIEQYYQKSNRKMSFMPLVDAHHPLLHIMTVHDIAAIIPLRRASKFVGYMAIGSRQSGQYDSRDLKILESITGEMVIAIENALTVLEVKELNTTLQQRVTEATRELRESNAQLRHLDEVKDEFLSIASHQLRTPLTSVKGYISLVLDGDAGEVSPQQRHLLEEAFSSSQRMVHLIEDFLNMSRLQTGRFVLDKRDSDIVKMVSDEVSHLQSTAAARNLTLKYQQGKELPASMNIDEGKLRQVVMNFIDNAIYYSQAGEEIRITLERRGTYVEFKVIDTGIGVPLEAQKQLFGKFYRAGNARKRRPDGTGVGLYLAKKVVTEHGGKVIFESTENKGSTFGFRLPIDQLLPKDNAK